MKRFGLLWQQHNFEREIAKMQPSIDRAEAASASLLNKFNNRVIDNELSLYSKYLSASSQISKTMDIYNLSDSFQDIAAIDNKLLTGMDSIQKQMTYLPKYDTDLANYLDLTARAVADSMVGTEALLHVTETDFNNITVLTRAHESYALFAESELDRALSASDVAKANMVIALEASASLLPDMSHISELGIFWDPALANTLVDLPKVNIFQELDTELENSDLEDSKINTTNIVNESPSAFVVKVGGRILQIVYDLNVEAERYGKEPIFKPTTKTMRAFQILSTTVANKEILFLEIVDNLYFLLYEGSGSATRLTDHISDEKLEALWLLKHLRLGFCHDTDHGNKSKSIEKSIQIGNAYTNLIGRPIAKTREDWLKAQQTLYKLLVDMLETIWTGDIYL